MKTKAPYLLLLFAFTIAKAQSFQPSVIASSGSTATFSGGSMDWTIGEVVTLTATVGSHSFTQGFNQPTSNSNPTGINKTSTPQFTVSCYPNPVTNKLFVDFSKASDTYILSVYTVDGKKLNEYMVIDCMQPVVIPFAKYTDGIYIVNIVSSETNQKSSFKVIKSN
jgi:hypothetical protein